MPATISNFLVGLGFSYDDKGIKQFNSGMESMKSKALQVGAVVGSAFGFKKLTVDAARNADSILKFSHIYGIAASQVNALNQEMISFGGSSAESMENISSLSKILAETPQKQASLVGQAGQELLPVGAVQKVLAAKNAFQAYNEVVAQGSKLTKEQQMRFASLFGLSQRTTLQMEQGPKKFNEQIKNFSDIRPQFQKMSDEAAKFDNSLQVTEQRLKSISDTITTAFLPPITAGLNDLNTFLNDHKQGIASGLDFIGKHALELIAAFAGFKFLGLSKLFSFGARAAGVGVSEAVVGAGTGFIGGVAAASIAMQEQTASPIPENVQLFGAGPQSQRVLDITTPQQRAMARAKDSMTAFDFSKIKPQPEPKLPSSGFGFGFQPLPPVNVSLNLDGKEIDKKIIDLNHQQNHHTLNELKSPVRG